jgi:hypothetical protein
MRAPINFEIFTFLHQQAATCLREQAKYSAFCKHYLTKVVFEQISYNSSANCKICIEDILEFACGRARA